MKVQIPWLHSDKPETGRVLESSSLASSQTSVCHGGSPGPLVSSPATVSPPALLKEKNPEGRRGRVSTPELIKAAKEARWHLHFSSPYDAFPCGVFL